jgi:hypothetical protein
MKKVLNLDLSSICRDSFTTNIGKSEVILKVLESERRRKIEEGKNPEHTVAKAIYFDSKKINDAIDEIFYSVENTYLIYFLDRFKVEFENRELFYLKEEDLNSLAMISLYFTLEAIRKDDFNMLDKIKNLNIEKKKNFVQKNMEALYFL